MPATTATSTTTRRPACGRSRCRGVPSPRAHTTMGGAPAMSARVPCLDTLRDKGIFAQFYDPEGQRYGLPTYPYHWAPAGLLTVRQLRAKGLRPGGQDIAAQILWRHRRQRRVAYLYREDQAKPKRIATMAQL